VYADEFSIYAGNANRPLAERICRYLKTDLGAVEVFQFANENIFVRVMENVREQDVFLVQPTSRPVNQSIMELLIMIDAFKRASAGRITAVIPFYSYGRSDKKDQPRVPITARLIADMLTVAGADRVLTMDLHQGQIQGFFSIPVDELTAVNLICAHIKAKELDDIVVVSELGFAKKARNFAELLQAPLAIVEKRWLGNDDRTEVMNIIGEVAGKDCLLIDDIVDSGGTLCNAADALLANGATSVTAYITHGVLSGGAAARIAGSKLQELVITDSIQPTSAVEAAHNIRIVSIADLIGEAISRTATEESVSSLFD
jgi:ribose-phosphate pyrophosphokinase